MMAGLASNLELFEAIGRSWLPRADDARCSRRYWYTGTGYSRALRGMGGMLRGGAGALLLLSSASMARAQSAQCANLTWSAPGDGSDVEREFAVAFALPVQAVPGSVRMVGSPECVQSSNINQFH